VFGVPGESFLAALDGMYQKQRVRFVNARQEGGATMMADAYGKLTGQPGIAFATRGPGATNASSGVHVAFQDSTPMILLLGQVGRDMMEREAFQEIDYRQMFGPMSKWVAQIDDARRIPEFISRAFFTATSGRPGPVVLALPEDMLTDAVTAADATPYVATQPAPDAADLARLRQLLAAAQRPLLMVGGSRWTDAACAQLQAFAETWQLPTTASFRRMDLIDNKSPVYAGDFGLAPVPSLPKRLQEADLVIAVGTRLGGITTKDHATLEALQPRPTFVHVYPDADELGRVIRPQLGIVAGPVAFAAALATLTPDAPARWSAWTRAANADYVATLEPSAYDGALDMGRALADLRAKLPRDAIITLDAGNHTGWPQRYLSYGRPGREIGPTNGAMGYSVPAADVQTGTRRGIDGETVEQVPQMWWPWRGCTAGCPVGAEGDRAAALAVQQEPHEQVRQHPVHQPQPRPRREQQQPVTPWRGSGCLRCRQVDRALDDRVEVVG
jgi:acetolactate synthase-1/2/3 large subunit